MSIVTIHPYLNTNLSSSFVSFRSLTLEIEIHFLIPDQKLLLNPIDSIPHFPDSIHNWIDI